MRPTYEVVATRSGKWWGLTVPSVPGVVSQVRRLPQWDEYAREAIAFVLSVEPDSFDLRLHLEVPGIPAETIAQVQDRIREAERVQRDAAAASRELVERMKGAGLTGADTAAVLGISPQRVSQLIAGKAKAKPGVKSAKAKRERVDA